MSLKDLLDEHSYEALNMVSTIAKHYSINPADVSNWTVKDIVYHISLIIQENDREAIRYTYEERKRDRESKK